MGIVKLALIVLAMVFSAAPLPFSDQLGSDAHACDLCGWRRSSTWWPATTFRWCG